MTESMPIDLKSVYDAFPVNVQKASLELRALILETAQEEKIVDLLETLKWGQPSYLSPIGSTIRIGTSSKHPGHICLFFICTTNLVDTFKELFGAQFSYEGNRAIVLPLQQELPTDALKRTIALALSYQQIKHLPLLGQ